MGVSYDLMHVSDWLPTLYEAAGGNLDDLGDNDSQSLFSTLTGESDHSPRNEVLVNLNPMTGSKSIIVGGYKYILNPHEEEGTSMPYWYKATGSDPDSYEEVYPNTTDAQICCGEVPSDIDIDCHSGVTGLEECLFDLENDPCEYYNLVDLPEMQSIKDMLKERIEYWEELQEMPCSDEIVEEANPKYHNWTWEPWTNDPGMKKADI